MNIKITLLSSTPIYLQIVNQIKNYIITNKVEEYQLPSIRNLAKELEVGIITVKKAYEILIQENYIYSKGGVGYFVKKLDFEKILEENINDFSSELKMLLKEYKKKNVKKEDILSSIYEVMQEVYKDEN